MERKPPWVRFLNGVCSVVLSGQWFLDSGATVSVCASEAEYKSQLRDMQQVPPLSLEAAFGQQERSVTGGLLPLGPERILARPVAGMRQAVVSVSQLCEGTRGRKNFCLFLAGEYVVGDVELAEDILNQLVKSPAVWHRGPSVGGMYPLSLKGEFGPAVKVLNAAMGNRYHYLHRCLGHIGVEAMKWQRGHGIGFDWTQEEFLARKHVCAACAQGAMHVNPTRPMPIPRVIWGSGQCFVMDSGMARPPSFDGYRYPHVLVDLYDHCVYCIYTIRMLADEISKAVDCLFLEHPDWTYHPAKTGDRFVRIDNGSSLKASEMQVVLSKYSYGQEFAPVEDHRAMGSAERAVRMITEGVQKALFDHENGALDDRWWVLANEWVCFMDEGNYDATLKTSPYSKRTGGLRFISKFLHPFGVTCWVFIPLSKRKKVGTQYPRAYRARWAGFVSRQLLFNNYFVKRIKGIDSDGKEIYGRLLTSKNVLFDRDEAIEPTPQEFGLDDDEEVVFDTVVADQVNVNSDNIGGFGVVNTGSITNNPDDDIPLSSEEDHVRTPLRDLPDHLLEYGHSHIAPSQLLPDTETTPYPSVLSPIDETSELLGGLPPSQLASRQKELWPPVVSATPSHSYGTRFQSRIRVEPAMRLTTSKPSPPDPIESWRVTAERVNFNVFSPSAAVRGSVNRLTWRDDPRIPRTFQRAVTLEPWLASVLKEQTNYEEKEALWLVEDTGQPRVHTLWLFERKNDGTEKSRLVLRGDQMREGIHYEAGDLYMANVTATGIKIALTIASTYGLSMRGGDVDGAYLVTRMDTPVAIHTPQGWYCPPGFVFMAIGNLYGGRTAANNFGKSFDSCVDKAGFVTTPWDPKLFWKWHNDGTITLLIAHSDDFRVFASTQHSDEYDKFVEVLKTKKYTVKETTDKPFVGIRITQMVDGSYSMDQAQYKQMIIESVPCYEEIPVQSLPHPTDCSPLTKADRASELKAAGNLSAADEAKLKAFPYRRIVGELQYMQVHTGVTTMYDVSVLSRFTNDYGPKCVAYLLHLIGYLKHSLYDRVPFPAPVEGAGMLSWEQTLDRLQLHYCCDADLGGGEDLHSQECYLGFLGPCLISFASHKQSVISTSTFASELSSLSTMLKSEVLHTRRILNAMGFWQRPIKCLDDNQSVTKTSANPNMTRATRFLPLNLAWVQEMVEDKIIVVEHIPSGKNPSDIGTKYLTYPLFRAHSEKLVVSGDGTVLVLVFI